MSKHFFSLNVVPLYLFIEINLLRFSLCVPNLVRLTTRLCDFPLVQFVLNTTIVVAPKQPHRDSLEEVVRVWLQEVPGAVRECDLTRL